MRQIYPDLWQTETEHPFPGVSSNAYLLTRDGGNVLFYGTGALSELNHMAQLGGLSRHYLSHRHEAGPSLAVIKERFGSVLCCHREEAGPIERFSPVDLRFAQREIHLGDIQVIPMPGHTIGSTCFVYQSPYGKRYLFTGDTLSPSGQSWASLVFTTDGGSSSKLRTSLIELGELEPDVVVASAFEGEAGFNEVTAAEWRSITARAAASL